MFSPSYQKKVRLNEYETAPFVIQLRQNLTSDCLLIAVYLPGFTLFCTMCSQNCSADQNKPILWRHHAKTGKIGKYTEINKQSHFMSWLKWRILSRTSKIGSGKNTKYFFFLLGLKYTLRTCFETKNFFVKFLPWAEQSGTHFFRLSNLLEYWHFNRGPSKLDAPISSKQFSGLKLCF